MSAATASKIKGGSKLAESKCAIGYVIASRENDSHNKQTLLGVILLPSHGRRSTIAGDQGLSVDGLSSGTVVFLHLYGFLGEKRRFITQTLDNARKKNKYQ